MSEEKVKDPNQPRSFLDNSVVFRPRFEKLEKSFNEFKQQLKNNKEKITVDPETKRTSWVGDPSERDQDPLIMAYNKLKKEKKELSEDLKPTLEQFQNDKSYSSGIRLSLEKTVKQKDIKFFHLKELIYNFSDFESFQMFQNLSSNVQFPGLHKDVSDFYSFMMNWTSQSASFTFSTNTKKQETNVAWKNAYKHLAMQLFWKEIERKKVTNMNQVENLNKQKEIIAKFIRKPEQFWPEFSHHHQFRQELQTKHKQFTKYFSQDRTSEGIINKLKIIIERMFGGLNG